MSQEWVHFDRVVNRIGTILNKCAEPYGIEILSAVLYGSRARGERATRGDYEIMILVDDNTPLSSYVKLTNTLKIEFLKELLTGAKVTIYTPEVFEDILYNDRMVGTFLYMMCRENVILFDKNNIFTSIKERICSNNVKSEEEFLAQCVEFAKMLGSEKWERKWEKTLMQFKYTKHRRGR